MNPDVWVPLEPDSPIYETSKYGDIAVQSDGKGNFWGMKIRYRHNRWWKVAPGIHLKPAELFTLRAKNKFYMGKELIDGKRQLKKAS